ncbi:shikimate kinase [Bacillus nitroreducens]
MRAIYLTGFMGAGKTTIGQKLGQALNLPVIDTDHYIEDKVGKKIATIFSEDGEQTFRNYERLYLKEIPANDLVITTGGGIVIQEENRNWMKDNGYVIFLYCDIGKIFDRVQNDPTRPLFDVEKKENTIKLYQERMPFYNEAHYKIDTTEKNLDEVVDDILSWLHLHKGGNNNTEA